MCDWILRTNSRILIFCKERITFFSIHYELFHLEGSSGKIKKCCLRWYHVRKRPKTNFPVEVALSVDFVRKVCNRAEKQKLRSKMFGIRVSFRHELFRSKVGSFVFCFQKKPFFIDMNQIFYVLKKNWFSCSIFWQTKQKILFGKTCLGPLNLVWMSLYDEQFNQDLKHHELQTWMFRSLILAFRLGISWRAAFV